MDPEKKSKFHQMQDGTDTQEDVVQKSTKNAE